MAKIRELVNEGTIKRKGNSVIEDAFKAIQEDSEIKTLFDEATAAGSTSAPIDKDAKKDIYRSILTKCFHARAGEETDKYNETYTGRNAGADVTLREGLKVVAGKQAGKKAKASGERLDLTKEN
jgi:hypothetical protein